MPFTYLFTVSTSYGTLFAIASQSEASFRLEESYGGLAVRMVVGCGGRNFHRVRHIKYIREGIQVRSAVGDGGVNIHKATALNIHVWSRKRLLKEYTDYFPKCRDSIALCLATSSGLRQPRKNETVQNTTIRSIPIWFYHHIS